MEISKLGVLWHCSYMQCPVEIKEKSSCFKSETFRKNDHVGRTSKKISQNPINGNSFSSEQAGFPYENMCFSHKRMLSLESNGKLGAPLHPIIMRVE